MSVADDFNRADGGLGANWANTHNTGPQISSNVVFGGTASNYNAAHWVANSFNDDQTSQITKANAANYIGVGVRHSTGSGGNYYAYFNHGLTAVQKVIAGIQTIISDGDVAGPGDVMKIAVTGTSITTFLNGTPFSFGPTTDASLSSGAAGIVAYDTTGSADDWIGTGEIVLVAARYLLVRN